MPFKPGQSGNQSGRPKTDPKFTALLKSKQEWALKELIKLAQSSEEDSVRLKAIQYIIDRAQGKPSQALNIGDQDGQPFKINVIISQAGKE